MGRFDLTDRQRAREALGRSQGGLDEKRACNYRAMLTTAMILLWF